MNASASPRLLPVAALLALVPACRSVRETGVADPARPPATGAGAASGTWVVEPAWKERLAVPYAFVERRGDYRACGEAMRELFQRIDASAVTPAGAPFGLFYDDPASVPAAELRYRACIPVEADASLPAELGRDRLPGGVVVYGQVRGPYAGVASSYAGLFALARKLGWSTAGPVRETYLVNPATVRTPDELVTEIQIARSGAP